ncbi:MAG: nuclear transport factor 2 family protein [Candidatus Lokiarchaeota archaeon]|nr:nuclear transport factor 2 family protein [Candidatus Lokiarchaeota archaeon]
MNAENEVKRVLDLLAEAFADKDIEKYKMLYEDHPNLVIYGSQKGEKWTNLAEYIKSVSNNWELVDNLELTYDWQRIDVNPKGTIAWIATDMCFTTTSGGQNMKIPGRFTAVLVKSNTKWRMVQSHFSMEH